MLPAAGSCIIRLAVALLRQHLLAQQSERSGSGHSSLASKSTTAWSVLDNGAYVNILSLFAFYHSFCLSSASCIRLTVFVELFGVELVFCFVDF